MSTAIIMKEATFKTRCLITDNQIYPGDLVVEFSEQVRVKMVQEATASLPQQLPTDVMGIIMAHTAVMSDASIGKWMKVSAVPTSMVTKTKSGRISKPVLRHDERDYKSGTYDHYDRGYNRGACYDNGYGVAATNEASEGENLLGFVVSDEEEDMESVDLLSDDEEDIESVDLLSDDEEETEWDDDDESDDEEEY